MDPLSLATPENLSYALGAATLGLSSLLAIRGWRFEGRTVTSAASAAVGLADPHGRAAQSSRRHVSSRTVRASLRLPVLAPREGSDAVPEGILAAHGILCDALEWPEAPHPALAAFLDARRDGEPAGRTGFRPHHDPVHGPAAGVTWRHAWWETVLLDLMVECRGRGAWVSAADLNPFLVDRPDVMAALRAGRDGAVAPLGAGIVAHWQAEKSAGRGIRPPRTAAALAAVEGAAR